MEIGSKWGVGCGGGGVVVYSSIDNGYVVCVDLCVEEREISTKREGLGKVYNIFWLLKIVYNQSDMHASNSCNNHIAPSGITR